MCDCWRFLILYFRHTIWWRERGRKKRVSLTLLIQCTYVARFDYIVAHNELCCGIFAFIGWQISCSAAAAAATTTRRRKKQKQNNTRNKNLNELITKLQTWSCSNRSPWAWIVRNNFYRRRLPTDENFWQFFSSLETSVTARFIGSTVWVIFWWGISAITTIATSPWAFQIMQMQFAMQLISAIELCFD